jgi:hypothetical protein
MHYLVVCMVCSELAPEKIRDYLITVHRSTRCPRHPKSISAASGVRGFSNWGALLFSRKLNRTEAETVG